MAMLHAFNNIPLLFNYIQLLNNSTSEPLNLSMAVPAKNYFLPLVVFAQFAGTSLWFAGNAVIHQLQQEAGHGSIASITSLVQFGFIGGTLVFALLTLADRFKPSVLFFVSCCVAATANALMVLFYKDVFVVSGLRFLTGFFLAGIYPVGMKIAADWFPQKLGNALGFLVGALVLGTAFPHLLNVQLYALPWKAALLCTSALAFTGGLLLWLLVPSKPPVAVHRFQPKAAVAVFRSPNFRAAAFGYFGHMWELYTLWAFLPAILLRFNRAGRGTLNVPLWSFTIIAAGAAGCVIGGLLSQKTGSKKVAFVSLVISGTCCLLAPLAFQGSPVVFLTFLLIWGTTVVSDSPQFSSLVAQSAVPHYKGTALTMVTCLGFAFTIASIQLTQVAFEQSNKALWLLAAGPLSGLLALSRWKRPQPLKGS
jgi:MFS family permease